MDQVHRSLSQHQGELFKERCEQVVCKSSRSSREMPSNSIGSFSFISRFLFSLLILSIPCEKSIAMASTLGGVRDTPVSEENSVQHDELARFAVEEHNKKEVSIFP
jgi:hypothetical protein